MELGFYLTKSDEGEYFGFKVGTPIEKSRLKHLPTISAKTLDSLTEKMCKAIYGFISVVGYLGFYGDVKISWFHDSNIYDEEDIINISQKLHERIRGGNIEWKRK